MHKTGFAEQLAFVTAQRGEDEALVLARAVRTGLHVLYQEVLVESYLMGETSCELLLREIGPEQLEMIDDQQGAIERDIRWGTARG
jgi:hypothetical protein